MKTWCISGIYQGEEFTALLTVDDCGDVVEVDYPLHDLLGMSWADARSHCITQGWHGDRHPSHIEGNSELRRRGWTDRQIKQYLAEPDTLAPNPHHPGGSPMRCYRIQRIEALETQLGISKILETSS